MLGYQEGKIAEHRKNATSKFPMLDYVSYLQANLLKTLEATHESTVSKVKFRSEIEQTAKEKERKNLLDDVGMQVTDAATKFAQQVEAIEKTISAQVKKEKKGRERSSADITKLVNTYRETFETTSSKLKERCE